VAFTGTPSGGSTPYTYAWAFGDGTSSTAQSPSHTYAAAGTYSAILTVTDALGAKPPRARSRSPSTRCRRRAPPPIGSPVTPDCNRFTARHRWYVSLHLRLDLWRWRQLDGAEPEPHLQRRGRLHRQSDSDRRQRTHGTGERADDHDQPALSAATPPAPAPANVPLAVQFHEHAERWAGALHLRVGVR